MLGDAGIEAVVREEFLTPEQAEAGFRHDQVQVGGLGADRAVALRDGDRGGGGYLEAYAAAVTAAGVNDLYSIQKRETEPPNRVARSAMRP